MKNSRKQLIAQIAMMERNLKYQQVKVTAHKKYLLDLLNDNRVVLMATFLPAFIWGWKLAREKRVSQMIKPLIKLGLVSAIGSLKQQILIK